MPKLSIIIPVYNTATYLRRCLDSILAQDFKDWELIIVDDGSKDGSREIIKEYAEKDARIKTVFHSENCGAGATRNSGLREAKGEFVAFVDSDDWLEKEMYSSLLAKQAESGADLVECNVMRHEEGREPRPEFKDMPGELDLKNNSDNYLLAMYKKRLSTYTVNKIFRHSLIKTKEINFPEDPDIKITEDLLFLLLLSRYYKSSAALAVANYHYCRRPGSLSKQKIKNPEKNITLFLEYYAKKASTKTTPAEKLIIISQIKFILLPCLAQALKPIKEGATLIRQVMKNRLLRESATGLLFYPPVYFKDRILIWLLYLRAYYLYSLLFYIYARYQQGSFRNLYTE